MKPVKIFGFPGALQISVSALLVCGLQSYAQRLDVTTERTNVGTFVSIDVPGADLGTVPVSINNGGVITGYYLTNPYDVSHGFVRSRDGTIVTFDPQNTIAPGAGSCAPPCTTLRPEDREQTGQSGHREQERASPSKHPAVPLRVPPLLSLVGESNTSRHDFSRR